MSARRLNHVVTAAAVGLVLTMTGCSELMSNDGQAPTGDALYQAASERYHAYAPGMHEVLMAVHLGEWQVDQGAYGASATSCQIGPDEFGYAFNYARTATVPDASVDEMVDAAVAAFDSIGLAATVATFGSGEAEERNVVAEGESVGRAVVTIRPATGTVRVTARTLCTPGSASDLTIMVFGGEDSLDVWQRLPATEGPDSVPQFYFPADGPLYYTADGIPVDPQPVVTEIPVAPYGK